MIEARCRTCAINAQQVTFVIDPPWRGEVVERKRAGGGDLSVVKKITPPRRASTMHDNPPPPGEGKMENCRQKSTQQNRLPANALTGWLTDSPTAGRSNGGFPRVRPNHLTTGFAVHLLPLRQHHLVRRLRAMMSGIGGELDMPEERRDVGRVEAAPFVRLSNSPARWHAAG